MRLGNLHPLCPTKDIVGTCCRGNILLQSCRHTVPDITVKTEVKDRIAKNLLSQHVLGFLDPFKPALKQAQDHKTHFETMSLPVAKILSPVARQAPTKTKESPGKTTGFVSWDKVGLSQGQNRGRPKSNWTKKFMFIVPFSCLLDC